MEWSDLFLKKGSNGEPEIKTIKGKPFKHNKETKRWAKLSKDAATVVSSVAPKVALESNSKNQDVHPAACVSSFSTMVQSAVRDVLYKFSHPQLKMANWLCGE